MAHISVGRDPLPVPAAFFQQRADFGVEFMGHDQIIAKFCADSKQHIAPTSRNALPMGKTPINQRVAANLRWYMDQAGLTESALGKRAKLSPRTIGNFLHPEKRTTGARGKPPSGKLAELESIADALGLDMVALIVESSDADREANRRLALAAHVLKTGERSLTAARHTVHRSSVRHRH